MNMFTQSLTVYCRSTSGDNDVWTPAYFSRVHTMWTTRIDGTSQNLADAEDSTVHIPYTEYDTEIHIGDYAVLGMCEQEAFTGNAIKTLAQYGAKRIVTIKPYHYGSSLDNVKLVCR